MTRTLNLTVGLFALAIAGANGQTPAQPARPDFATAPGWAYIPSAKCWAHFPDGEKGVDSLFLGWNGKCTAQKISGAGTLTNATELSITGTFENGELKGTGKVSWYFDRLTYDGTFSDGALHGTGKESWVDGSHYQGGFIDDKFDGQGRWDISSTVYYEGAFKNNVMYGQGTLTFPQGTLEGMFTAWAIDGNATYRQPGQDPLIGILTVPTPDPATPITPPPFPPTLRQSTVATAHFIVQTDVTLTDIHTNTTLPPDNNVSKTLPQDLEKAVQAAKYVPAKVGETVVPMPFEYSVAYGQ